MWKIAIGIILVLMIVGFSYKTYELAKTKHAKEMKLLDLQIEREELLAKILHKGVQEQKEDY